MDYQHGCDIVFFKKNLPKPKIYSTADKAYRPTNLTIALETVTGLKILLRATGGIKYAYVDEWQFTPDLDEEGHPGKYFEYTLRGANTAPTNVRDRDCNGKPRWIRVKSLKIES